MTRHELKTWPKYFAAVRSGQKRFEIRRNDREFKVGDILVLREFDPEDDAYTGQTEERQITFLLSEEDYGVIHGFVAIGFGEGAELRRRHGREATGAERRQLRAAQRCDLRGRQLLQLRAGQSTHLRRREGRELSGG